MAESDKPNFDGKWVLDRSENFEAFLEEYGTNWMQRKMITKATPTLEITQTGDDFLCKLGAAIFKQTESFTVGGDEFDATEQNGATSKGRAVWEGSKLVLTYKPVVEGSAKAKKVIREIINDELVQTMEVNNVTCKRIFKKAQK